MSNPFAPQHYLDLNHTEHRMLFDHSVNVWDALSQIVSYLQFRLKPGVHGRLIGKPFISGAVFVGKGTVIEQGAMVKGPAWIGEGCEIRNGCYIRENVIIGSGCVIGNSCELKNSIVLDEAQIPHFNYVGDSIIGYRGHLGAGVILSNVKLDHGEIVVAHHGRRGADGPEEIRRDHRRPRGDRVQLRAQSRLAHRAQHDPLPRHLVERRRAGGQRHQDEADARGDAAEGIGRLRRRVKLQAPEAKQTGHALQRSGMISARSITTSGKACGAAWPSALTITCSR